MAQTAAEYEKELLANIKEKTGQDLKTWMGFIHASSLTKTKEITNWLKTEYQLNHAQATMLAMIFVNDGKPVYGDIKALFDALFKGKEDKRPIYDALETKIKAALPDAKITPLKGYVSFRGKKEFGCATITAKEIRVGLGLGEAAPFNDYLKKAKSLGAMPCLTHMVEVREAADINADLLKYLQESFQRVQ